MAKVYSAGIATAYGAAKRGGYTGTYEDFCREQAGFAENAQQVAEDREAVEALASQFENTTVPQAITDVQTEAATQISNVNEAGAAQVQRVQEEGTTQIGRVQLAVTEQMDRAELAANNALTSERNSADSASAASESEAAAAASETAAAQSAAQAQETVDGALSAINTAKETALAAVDSAEDDAVQAVQTEGATQTANAKAQADAASASATAAAGSATTASTKAGEAADSATAAAGSASDAEADKEAAEAAQAAAEAAAQSVSESAAQIARNAEDIAGLKADKYKAYATDTASGPIASFPDGADDIPVKDLSVGIEPVQSGSGDPSPDNIRPISGWTGAEVTRTGRNLLDTKNFAPATTTSSGITLVQNQDGSFKASGTATGTVNFWLRGSWGGTNPVLKLYAGKTYFIKDVMLYNGTSVIGPYVYMGNSGTYTPTIDTVVTGVRASCPVGTTLDQTIYPYVTDSSDTEWQEFGDTYSITFPSEAGTVYGGTLDVTTGKLTVDRVSRNIDGNESWIASDGYVNRFAVTLPRFSDASANYQHFLSNYLVTSAWGTTKDTFAVRPNGGIYVTLDTDEPQMTVDEFKAFLNSNPLQLVYELATPIVYDLTPTEVRTLLAQNNIWADCGDSTVEYRADTKLYIDKKIAALAAAMN